jgi:hypothetical protein
MEVVNTHCAGLDVHKKTVVACVITPEFKAVCTFSTMTGGLLELADWLEESQVTQVAMESSGVFWKPVYNLLGSVSVSVWIPVQSDTLPDPD